MNVAETPPDSGPSESAYVTSAFISHDLTNWICAYLLTEPDTQGKNDIIIDSGATSHMACNQTWFTTYHLLSSPSLVTLGNNSSVEATGIRTVTLCTQVEGETNKFILSNILFVSDFWITLISVNKLAKAGLSTFSPRNTSTCAIYQGETLVMTEQHWENLYHVNATLVSSKEAANMSININTLHQCMGHISMD